MNIDDFRSNKPGRKNKVSKKKLLRTEQLEPRMLLSATNVLQGLLASSRAPTNAFGQVFAFSQAPTVAVAAAATANPVTGTTVQLSVLGADDGGESRLIYNWKATTVPTGAVAPSFSLNGANAAKNTTVTFKKAGIYVFRATIIDAGNLITTSSVTVTVNQTFTGISVAPATLSVFSSATQQFIATAYDQFGQTLTTQPAFTWTTTAGTISANGLFTAPGTGGPATVTAASGGFQGSANATIIGLPTVAQAAAAAANPVTGKSVLLTVLGASNAGENTLKYTWAATTLPAGAAMPTFSANGTNAAKNATVTFKKAGTYIFTATITDAGIRSVTSSVTVVVNQTLTSISVSPSSASVLTGATQQFAATGLDQFGNTLATQPAFTWATTSGSIDANGLFTAPGTSGSATIAATSGTITGTSSMTILNRAPTVSVAAAAAANPVTGTTTLLSVLGADDAGESNLKYSWSVASLPAGATAPSFSVNGTNAAKNTTVTFKAAGSYIFKATITDAGKLTVISSVTVTVNPIFSGIILTPSVSTVFSSATQQFFATGVDQFNKALTIQPAFTWTTTAGTIDANGLFAVPGTGGSATVTVSSGGIQSSTTLTVIGLPTVAQAAAAAANPISGKTVLLSVLGASDAGESTLKYTWTTTAYPAGAAVPMFSVNGTNAAKNTTIKFKKAGTYILTATIADIGNRTIISSVTVVVNQTLTSISVSPSSAAILTSTTQQFTATGLDQFGEALTTQPAVTWSTTYGSIDAAGLFTALGTSGSATITAASGSVLGTAYLTIQNRAPTVSVAAAAAANPVTGATVLLSILGADDAGESNLKYTWTATTIPAGATAPTFSVNKTNAAKNVTATFKKAGTYVFKATIADSGGLSVTSSITVVVNQTLTGINVTPSTPSVFTGATQQFAATAYDQFGNALATQPAFTWAATTGTITTAGLFTAPGTGGTATITATSGAIQGSTSVTLIGPPTVAQAAAAAANPVTGKNVLLSILGASNAGESTLKYTWVTTSLPTSVVTPTFSSNGTNSSKNTTVTFKAAGTYVFTATITDTGNRSVTSIVTVTVSQTLTSITITPSTASIRTGTTQQLTATGYDQFGNGLTVQPAFTWATTAGTIGTAGLFSAPGMTCTATVTAASGLLKGVASVTIQNSPPTVSVAAAASLSTSTTALLSVLGADDAGESNLKYSWVTTSSPAGALAPIFSTNGVNASKNATVTFRKAGTYIFTVTIADAGNLAVTSSVTVTVNQTFTSISVTPSTLVIITGSSRQFTATSLDQFGNLMTTQPVFTWATDQGAISSSGLFTAPGTAGTATVTATSGAIQGTASITFGLLGLQDVALANLTQTLFADGSISRQDMIQILQCTGADGSVSATEISDLQTILANSATLNIPDYVKVLAGDVVNSNQANASYQGQSLGNLTAGSPASRLNSLINKWFFGADRPVIDANVPSGQTYTYRSTSGTLFSGNPSHSNEFQGMLGDCYFVAALGSVADRSPAAIQNMFLDNGDGTWTVRFFANGVADYVTVDRMLPTDSYGRLVYANYGSMYNNSANTLWIPLAEKAYAQWNETGKEGRNGSNRYSAIEGGDPAVVFSQTLGHSANSYYLTVQQYLINAMNLHWSVTICTRSSGSSLPYGLYGNHAYGVIGYSSAAGTFTLYNPWGTNQPTSALTWAQLQSTCTVFEVVDPSGTVPISTAIVSAAIKTKASIAEIPAIESHLACQSISTEGDSIFRSSQDLKSVVYQEMNARDRLFAPESVAGIDLLANRTVSITSAGKYGKHKTPLDISLSALDEFYRTGAMLN